MGTRSVLIHGYARKNKSRRKKYFVVSIGPDYLNPRLDYFPNIQRWNSKRHEIFNDHTENISFQSINLNYLFFLNDNLKKNGLNLYMEDRHVTLSFSTEELKRKWQEILGNIIYKNGKFNMYPKIEHVLQARLRIKPKENLEKSLFSQLRGLFRVCFMKMSMLFVNKSIDKPAFTVQYPFIRQWESRPDGTFRLEIGRAAVLGECLLILQLSDHEEAKAAHSVLANCIRSFRMSKPEPPKIRSSSDKQFKRNSSASWYQRSEIMDDVTESSANRSESCITFLPKTSGDTRSSNEADIDLDDNYVPMKKLSERSDSKLNKYVFEHICRIYKCSNCNFVTKLITFCSNCTNISPDDALQFLTKTEPQPLSHQPQVLFRCRDKAQSLTERPRPFRIIKQKPISDSSKSVSKTSSSNDISFPKLDSEISLPVSANRHDDDIFMELDFDNLEISRSSQGKPSLGNIQQFQLKCGNCQCDLFHNTNKEKPLNILCDACCQHLTSLSFLIEDNNPFPSDWRPRTTSLIPLSKPKMLSATCSSNSEYVEVNIKNEYSLYIPNIYRNSDICAS